MCYSDGSIVLEGMLAVTDRAAGSLNSWHLNRYREILGVLMRFGLSDFRPGQPLLKELHKRHPGLRICRTESVWEAALGTIVEQMVPTVEAYAGWRGILRCFGEPAPDRTVDLENAIAPS